MKKVLISFIITLLIFIGITNVVYATPNYYKGTQKGSYVATSEDEEWLEENIENYEVKDSLNSKIGDAIEIARILCVVFICILSVLAYIAATNKDTLKVIVFVIVIGVLVFVGTYFRLMING